MKYDILIVGAGPAGLMAAHTAAKDGLTALVIDRKMEITRIDRACSQIFYLRKLSPSGDPGGGSGKAKGDGYIDPVSVECLHTSARLHFHTPGFSLDYHGPLRPYLNWFHLSPGGLFVNRYPSNDRPWGFYYHKEAFVKELFALAEKSGAIIRPETAGLSAENIEGGVRATVEGPGGVETIEARALVAADGLHSRVVESLGLNANRRPPQGRRNTFLQYIMEGVAAPLPEAACSYLTWTVPSINPTGFIAMGLSEEGRIKLGALTQGDLKPEAVLNSFIADKRFAPFFRKAKTIKREGMSRPGPFSAPIRHPVAGNVLIAGDAGSIAETWIQGAVASGYQAVKAIEKEFAGQNGYDGYVAWWQQAFAFNTPDYLRMLANFYPIPRICTDEEIDYIYRLFEGRTGIPQLLIESCMNRIQTERPELHARLVASLPAKK